ncbi:serine hydrolase [Sphingopyxis granuli]|uniref:serine hydrolase n=1 Tax=Sphingopyxis granuli TaxID=267128 RepID=UPI001BAF8AB0|nr:serine hydrolase [Sphingopyxis granuli]QUM71214.1 serine hydrolase [Sphingopyxis granuli]
MTRLRTALLSSLLLAAALPAPALLAQPTETAVPAAASFDARAGQIVGLLTGRVPFADSFAPSFQTAVPEAQFRAIAANLIAQYGQPIAIAGTASDNGRSGTVRLRFERGIATVRLDIGPPPEARITGLQFTGFTVSDDTMERVTGEIAGLPGRSGFLVAEIDGNAIRPIASANPDRQFATGSTFKLYVLDELAAAVATGERRWRDVVPLSHLSFSSAATGNWPPNTPVTLQTLANWMISVSDNGAADTLIHLLGRERIEARMRAAGHSAPSRNIPFLTTVEAFALKGDNFADLRAPFIAGNDAQQRRILDANRHRFTLAQVDGVSFGGEPRFIDDLEWFASPMDVARVLVDLKARRSDAAMAAMAINNGVGPAAAADWSWLGYKGGSELGVLSMSLLGRRKVDGKWFVVTASWNNDKTDLDGAKLVGLVTRLLALAARDGVTPSAPPPAP